MSGGDEDREFYISPDKGSIIIAKTLDAERRGSYNITVSVTDGIHVVQAVVYVTVIDANEKRPEFSGGPTFEVEVAENAMVGSKVIRLNVTDGDERQKVFFGFHSSQHVSSLSKFRIDPMTGDVTVKQPLDRERVRRHVLIVVVKDEGTPGTLIIQMNHFFIAK